MRILQVVTHMSSDGAYGGPVTVAREQCAELERRGHDVTLLSSAPRSEIRTTQSGKLVVTTFPYRRVLPVGGFAAFTSPALLRHVHQGTYDVAHIHFARDLVAIPSAALLRSRAVPLVLQTHGMVDPSTKPSAKMLDILATRRLLRAASAVLSLTAQEDSDLRQVEPASRVSRLGNGVSIGELPDWSERERVVLFLARLHPRKRPVAFVEMAALLRDRLPGYTFLVAGPDEGEAPAVSKRIDELRLADVVKCIGPVPPDQTGDLLRSVSALVLPSVGEVFPMTLLESMRAGTPIVATESLGIADECVRYGAASITDGSPTALAEAVLDIVLPERAHLRRAGAERYLRENLDIAEVVNELEDVYARATSEARMNSSERGFH